jgi:hypothetical protein
MDNDNSSEFLSFENANFTEIQKKYLTIEEDFYEFIQLNQGAIEEEALDRFVEDIMLQKDEWGSENTLCSRDGLVFIRSMTDNQLQIISIQMNSGKGYRFPTPTMMKLRIKDDREISKRDSIDKIEFMIEDFYLSKTFRGTRSAEGICSKELFDPQVQPYTQRYYNFNQMDTLVKETAYICHHLSEIFFYAFTVLKHYLLNDVNLLRFTASAFYCKEEERLQIYMIEKFLNEPVSLAFDMLNYSQHIGFTTKRNKLKFKWSQDYPLRMALAYQNNITRLAVSRTQLSSEIDSLTNNLVSPLPMDTLKFLEKFPAIRASAYSETNGYKPEMMRKVAYCTAWQDYD